MLNFTELTTPRHDGETLVEPGPDQLASLAEANARRLAVASCKIHGRPLGALRADTRSALAGGPAESLVIVTGHQPEFYHAGVWAKNVVTARLASAVGGRAVNLVVDNDAPKKTTFTVPHHRGSVLTALEKPFAQYRVGWAFEQFPALDAATGRRILDELRTALGDGAYEASSLPLMASALTQPSEARDLVDQVTAARKLAEDHFGLDLVERRVSQCWGGPMLLDLLLSASRFAECYNAALADYRQAHGVRGTNRPVPDLAQDGDRVELPVWVYRHDQARRRLFVECKGDRITFHADAEPMGSLGVGELAGDDGMARLSAVLGWRFRPRALTLTMWARLLLADLFVHGIGGAKYDRITDRLIERYFGIEPPAMACVSATLRMPVDRFPVGREDLARARRKCRDAHYNPQRYLSAITDDVSQPLQQRVDAIAESDRLRREDRLNRSARRRAFLAIRRTNAEVLKIDPGLIDRLAAEVDRIRRQLDHNAVADSREYFFGLLPMAKLAQLLEALPSVEQLRAKA